MRAAIVVLAAALAWLALQPAASAQDASAGVLFRRGAAAYGAERYADAAALFEQAYALSHEPSMLYNLGLARQRAGDVRGAIESYRAFLAASPDAPERTEVETSLMTLERLVEAERVTEVDQAEVEPAPVEEIAPIEPPPVEQPGGGLSAGPVVVLGAGAAGLVVAAVLSGIAVDAHDGAGTEPVQLVAEQRAREAQDVALAANVAWAASGAIALGGAIWMIVELTSPGPSAPVSVSIGPAAIRVRGSF